MKKTKLSLLIFIVGMIHIPQVHAINFSLTKLITACLAINSIGAEPKNQSQNCPTMTPTIQNNQLPARRNERSEIPTNHQIYRRGLCPSCDNARDQRENSIVHARILHQMNTERTQSRTSL